MSIVGRVVFTSVLIFATPQSVAAVDVQGTASIRDPKHAVGCADLGPKPPLAKHRRAPDEVLARQAVRDSLKDPQSAKFGKFSQVSPTKACLTVNARNAFGGYAGDHQALLVKQENQWCVIAIEAGLGHDECRVVILGM